MQTLNLIAKTPSQELVKAYLQENASAVLAEKINDGVIIEKDGKRLINRKTLEGFFKYACDEARKQAEKGKNSACIPDSVVFGWAIHYFEENGIEGTLYNEDGTIYKLHLLKNNLLLQSPPLRGNRSPSRRCRCSILWIRRPPQKNRKSPSCP